MNPVYWWILAILVAFVGAVAWEVLDDYSQQKQQLNAWEAQHKKEPRHE